jgi:hypothetical protein
MRYWVASGVSVQWLCLAAPQFARADGDTHYQDLIVGERAAGMGGAFTALANEASGAYYNPAGIVVDDSLLIQLSMSAFKLRRKQVEIASICGTNLTKDESAFFGFPGSLGLVRQFHHGGLDQAFGLTLVMNHSDKVGQSFVEKDTHCGPVALGLGRSRLQVDRAFWSGLSYAIKPWRFLQAGLTVGLSVRAATFSQLVAGVLKVDQANLYPMINFQNGDVEYRLVLQLRLAHHCNPTRARVGDESLLPLLLGGRVVSFLERGVAGVGEVLLRLGVVDEGETDLLVIIILQGEATVLGPLARFGGAFAFSIAGGETGVFRRVGAELKTDRIFLTDPFLDDVIIALGSMEQARFAKTTLEVKALVAVSSFMFAGHLAIASILALGKGGAG